MHTLAVWDGKKDDRRAPVETAPALHLLLDVEPNDLDQSSDRRGDLYDRLERKFRELEIGRRKEDRRRHPDVVISGSGGNEEERDREA